MNRYHQLGLCLLLALANTLPLRAQAVIGLWKTFDDKTNKPSSIIELYEEKGVLCGDILVILNENTKQKNPLCVKCPDDRKDQPVIGMQLIRGLKQSGDLWTGGTVVDPHTGKIYRCYLELIEPDKLKIRGYVGFSIFGRTQYWKRHARTKDEAGLGGHD